MTPRQVERPKACAYIRVSKVGMRGEDLISPELQMQHIRAHADKHGYDIVKVVEDIDKSGRDFLKRRISELVDGVTRGDFSKIIIWKWNRWGRRSLAGNIFMARVEEARGQIEAATEHVDAKTAYGKFSRSIFLALAELQGDQIGEGWKDVHSYRRRHGLPHNSQPRFGYRYVKDHPSGSPKYVLIKDQGEALDDAYQRYSKGLAGMRVLVGELNGKGFLNAVGKPWTEVALRDTMDSGFAAGWIRERSDPPGPGQTRSRAFGAFDLWRKGSHEPAVSEATWQAYRKKREQDSNVAPGLKTPKHALSGALFCSGCGRTLKTMYSYQRGVRYHRWHCAIGTSLKLHGPISVTNRAAMAAVMDWIELHAIGENAVAGEVEKLATKRDSADAETDRLARRIAELERSEDRLQEGWLSGKIKPGFYERKMAEIDQERETLAAQLEASRDRRERVEAPTVEQFRGVWAEWPRWSPAYQRAFLAEVLAGVVVMPSKELVLVPAWE